MLQSIEIENFRCFHHSRFENFGMVNLIGGMNNAGKTALLEAILLVNEPTWNSMAFLQQMRGEDDLVFSEHPELAWGNLFFKQDKNLTIKLIGNFKEKAIATVLITCKEHPKSITNGLGHTPGNGHLDNLIKTTESATMSEIGSSILSIQRAESDYNLDITYTWHVDRLGIKYGAGGSSTRGFDSIPNTFLVAANFKKTTESLAREFDKVKLRNETVPILEAFRIVDESIEKVDTANLGEPRIYVFRKGEKPQSLNFFGDALNKIADLILRVINNPNCILLIDEIENGIHHTNQQEFWRMLIKLAVEKNVQIFATSHSAEMIEAFQAAAVEEHREDKVRYITMYKSARTGEIVGAQRDMETLGYNLRTNNPYRGE